jgi:hypothetical protein
VFVAFGASDAWFGPHNAKHRTLDIFAQEEGMPNTVMAADKEKWTLERQLSRPGAVTSCAWSPDAMRLATVGGGRVGVWDVFTGREVGARPG